MNQIIVGAPNAVVRTPLIDLRKVEVKQVDDKVVIEIGGEPITFDYESAFDFAQGVRMAAKRAKAFAGDVSRHMRVTGNLTALDHNGDPIK